MIGDEDEKKYITIIKISLICFFGFLITLFIAFFIAIDYVDAETYQTTPTEGYWYNWQGSQTEVTQVSNRTYMDESYYQWQATSSNSQYLKASMYFPESENEKILAGQWDISFNIIGYGDFTIRLGQYTCFFTSSNPVPKSMLENTGAGANYQEFESDSSSPKNYSVYCPNVKVNTLPLPIRMYRQWTSTNMAQNRLIISKWWGFSSTINSNADIINNQNNNTQSIINSQNNTTNAINGVNDSINDDSVDDPTNDLSQMESQMPTNSTISDLLTLPVRLFQNVINAIDGRCSPFSLGSLYGTNITLPCINLQNLIGSNLYGVIDVILSGIFVLSIRKKFVDIFENLTSLRNGGNELE